ncbi:MAG: hypothetical protein GXO91_00750 [FCB group bacterium]|nr:hypothetical protein [FCB group bacterium]
MLAIGLFFGLVIYLPFMISPPEQIGQGIPEPAPVDSTVTDTIRLELAELFPPPSDCASRASKGITAENQARLNRSIRQAARYLEKVCNPDGQFLYRVNINPAVVPAKRYNLLRHAGTVYILAKYFRQSNDRAALTAVENALGFMQQKSLEAVPGHPNLLGVWSYPWITSSRSPKQLKLGGTGLGLTAMATYGAAFPDKIDLKQLGAMGDFLLFMQKDTGEFYSRYIDRQGLDDTNPSLYYPGEAILGLISLFRIYPSQKWLDGAIRGLTYLARSRADLDYAPADNWALIASAEILKFKNDSLTDEVRRTIVDHAIQISESILAEKKPRYSTEQRLGGCLTRDGKTTPTATRLEGLLAALKIIPEERADLRRQILKAVRGGICFLQSTQIQKGPYRGGFTRDSRPFSEEGFIDGDRFNDRATEIRIDYVQHALNALLEYRHLLSYTKIENS